LLNRYPQLNPPLLVTPKQGTFQLFSPLIPCEKPRGKGKKKGAADEKEKHPSVKAAEQERKAGHRRLSPLPGLPNSRGGKRKRETGTGRGRGREGGSRKKAGLAIVKSIKKNSRVRRNLETPRQPRGEGQRETEERERASEGELPRPNLAIPNPEASDSPIRPRPEERSRRSGSSGARI